MTSSWLNWFWPLRTSSVSELNEVVWPWMLRQMLIGFVVLVLASMIGCSRTVLVNPGSPIRVGPDASVRVYTLIDGEWQLSQNRVTLPEGWYLVDPEYVHQ